MTTPSDAEQAEMQSFCQGHVHNAAINEIPCYPDRRDIFAEVKSSQLLHCLCSFGQESQG